MKPRLLQPRGPEFLAYVNDLIVQNRLKMKDASLELPSLRSRAKLLTRESNTVTVWDVEELPTHDYSR